MAVDPSFDPRPSAHRRPGLDLLRSLAIVFVVLYHAGLFGFVLPFGVQRFGWIGVDLFFVLSGYLIGGQLLSVLRRGKTLDISRFYSRRALRILPAYFVVVAVCFFLPPAWREYERMPPIWKFLSFTQNLGLRGGTSFSHAWSLCIEFQFYLVLPFLILALARLSRAQTFVPFVILACVTAVRGALAYVNAQSSAPSFGWWQQWIYYPTYSRLDGLTIGVSLAAIECFRPAWWSALIKTASWIWLPGVVAITIALILAEDGLSVTCSAFGFLLVAAGCGAFLVCGASIRRSIPGAAFIATIAYSLYLTHKLAIHWVEFFQNARSLSAIPAYVLMLAFVLIVGSALFFAVERPFLRIREQRAKRA